DGLPAAASLTTTWSAIAGPGGVSFSNPTATFPDVAGQTNPVVTSAQFPVPGVYTVGLTGTDSDLTGNSSATITVSQSQNPAILSASPDSGLQGQTSLSIALAGQFTNWVQGATTAAFGSGISVASLTVNSPTSATAVISIDSTAATGARTIVLTTGGHVD